MSNKLVKLILVAVVILYIFHFFFFWLFEGTDSFFYYEFSRFLRTGSYYAPYPYMYNVPSTMEPPLYSVFLYLVQFFPRADIIIHFIQITGILASAYFIYRIMSFYTKKIFAQLSGIFFLLIPAHFIYISHVVAEPLAVFYLTFFLYLTHLIINLKKVSTMKILVPYSAVISLQRYNFLPLFIMSFIIFIFFHRRKKIMDYFGLTLGIAIIILWIVINHRLNGAWSLSNAEGKHLYNRIVHFDKLLPPEDNPDFLKFKKIVGIQDYLKPWWFYEPLLIPALGGETESSNLLQAVALAALKTDPARYLLNTPKFFLFAHSDNDMFHNDLYLYGKNMKGNCRILGSIHFCRPIFESMKVKFFWDRMVLLIDQHYLYLTKYINFFLLFPAIIYSLFQKNLFIRLCGILYIFCVLLFVMTEAPLGRYSYNFRSLGVILISYMIYKVYGRLSHRKKNA